MNSVPVIHIRLCSLNYIHFCLGIVDQSSKSFLILQAHGISKHIIDLSPDRSRAILEHMGESLVFSMYICQKMFRTFRQVQDCLKIDDLCGCGCDRGIQARQPFQISGFQIFHKYPPIISVLSDHITHIVHSRFLPCKEFCRFDRTLSKNAAGISRMLKLNNFVRSGKDHLMFTHDSPAPDC